MEKLVNDFQDFVRQGALLRSTDHLLLAVSGGIDSIVLCELCHRAGYMFSMAHCNFQLRGEESMRDEAFVRSLAQQYNCNIYVKRFETEAWAAGHNISIQVAARELRYSWFYSLLNGQETRAPIANLIATAHHNDDNVETVLMNYFKGTGVRGMRGILPRQNQLVRPLLFASRHQIETFARENQLRFVEDSSNTSVKYTRNYLRHKIIPEIQLVFPALKENIQNNILLARDMEVLYDQAIQSHKKKLLEVTDEGFCIAVEKLKKSKPLKTIIFEIIKDYGFRPKQTEEVLELLESDTGKFVLSETHRVLRNRKHLLITPYHKVQDDWVILDESTEMVMFSGKKMLIKNAAIDHKYWKPEPDSSIAQIDAENIRFPLILRRWKEGDYFYPLGMRKKKKLARFFIDQKLSLAEKENVWVLESDKRIIWVVNYRIDDRFKITPATARLLELKMLNIKTDLLPKVAE